MAVLITGGAGYIGRHTERLFQANGIDTVCLDNFSTSAPWKEKVKHHIEGDVRDGKLLHTIIEQYKIDSVIHLAASAHVGDSIIRPDLYFENNSAATITLLLVMMEFAVKRLIFASSCSVYGNSASFSVSEDEVVLPVSPYGESKLTTERMLPWYERSFGLQWLALRYFNVAGGERGLGENVRTSKRIIPRVVDAALGGSRTLEIYGDKFSTVDGSAVRDYVNVRDVAQANLKALQFLQNRESHCRSQKILNIGSGVGTSVFQIIEMASRLSGKKIRYDVRSANVGDPPYAVADPTRTRDVLRWIPAHSRIDVIVEEVLADAELCALRRKS